MGTKRIVLEFTKEEFLDRVWYGPSGSNPISSDMPPSMCDVGELYINEDDMVVIDIDVRDFS